MPPQTFLNISKTKLVLTEKVTSKNKSYFWTLYLSEIKRLMTLRQRLNVHFIIFYLWGTVI
jgi:hypothetical protein